MNRAILVTPNYDIARVVVRGLQTHYDLAWQIDSGVGITGYHVRITSEMSAYTRAQAEAYVTGVVDGIVGMRDAQTGRLR